MPKLKQPDDLLTEEIRMVVKEHACDCMETMMSFGFNDDLIDRSMRGLVTKLLKDKLLMKGKTK